MRIIPPSIERVIEEFNKLPGIGQKSAERLAFYLLKKPDIDVEHFGDTVNNMKKGIKFCNICKNLTNNETCSICESESRNKRVICIVEDVLDLVALEKSGEYKGVYHVLHGVISPIDGIGPDELTIAELIKRIKENGADEIIFALNPSMEGEATSAYLMRYIKPYNIKVSRIARGIPVGGNLEYADSQTIKRALEGRMEY